MAERATARGNEIDRRTMIVGPGMSFSGEIGSCDRLIIEGSITATLPKCQHVIIAETGVFSGNASTDNADVHGRFDGELVVRKRLLIRAAVTFPATSPTERSRLSRAGESLGL